MNFEHKKFLLLLLNTRYLFNKRIYFKIFINFLMCSKQSFVAIIFLPEEITETEPNSSKIYLKVLSASKWQSGNIQTCLETEFIEQLLSGDGSEISP